ncbi:MAG: RagB/SusD family nutrient uptake outer membrane protein [Sphingobacteriaceae bacterium]|nr:RagB/SusD family nutrient uptake outer membrane protein [Sphingobacteriaceae bacterium]
MKNIIKTTICLLVLFTFSSCKKYLDITPKGKLIPSTEQEFLRVLNSAYAIKTNTKTLLSIRADEFMITKEANAPDYNQYLNHFAWDENNASEQQVSYSWDSEYKIIFYCNYIINEIEKQDNLSVGNKQILGEAHLLRAFTYFNLVNTYGAPFNEQTAATDLAVPLIAENDLLVSRKRSSVKEIYNFITAEIEKSKSLVSIKVFPDVEKYRFNTQSLQAFETRVNLYLGKWENTSALAEKLLSERSALVDLNVAGAKQPALFSSVETIQAYQPAFQSLNLLAGLNMNLDLYNTYNDDDKRKAICFTEDGYLDMNTFEFIITGVSYKNIGFNDLSSCFRLSEIYLNAAEAYAQQDKLAEAKVKLLVLLAKRLKPTYYTKEATRINAISSKNDLLTEIYNERARELVFEGHRWFDLRRTKQPSIKHIFADKTYTLTEKDARYTVKIPLEVIKANPLLNE